MTRAKTNVLLIRTPEGVVFSQLLAGPVVRFLAWGLDLACITALAYGAGLLLGLLLIISPDVAKAVSVLLYFGISIAYGIVMEWSWRGQTVGKKVLRLRVVDVQGLRLEFSQIVIRNLLRFADLLPACYLVGGIACLISKRAQRLGDLAANTVVVRHPKLQEPDLDQLLTGKYNSLRDYPHLEGRLRQRISPAEAGLALQAILRRDSLDPQARVQLFGAIAAHFRARVEFPPEARDGIGDEQSVRNVVDALYRPRTATRKPVEQVPAL